MRTSYYYRGRALEIITGIKSSIISLLILVVIVIDDSIGKQCASKQTSTAGQQHPTGSHTTFLRRLLLLNVTASASIAASIARPTIISTTVSTTATATRVFTSSQEFPKKTTAYSFI